MNKIVATSTTARSHGQKTNLKNHLYGPSKAVLGAQEANVDNKASSGSTV